MTRYLLLSVLCCFPFFMMAQQQIISGQVAEKENGSPLPGVSVMVKSTTNGTITDFDGKYSLQASPGDVLVFSFIGMETQEVVVATQTTIDVALALDTEMLSDVVVVGYGVVKKKVSTGAIASVKSEDITQTPVSNAGQSLQGKTAGVTITTNSGAPGSDINILIRGVGSNDDTKPLFIVDGVQVGDINFLSPGDIESIDVLKDVASAAIYGSKAANGVVLVTTKGGKKGKMRVEYSGYFGIQNAWKLTPVLNTQEYMMLHNEASFNDGKSPVYSADDMEMATVSTNWQKEVFNSAPTTNHSLLFSGGTEKSTYLASVGYSSTDGIVGDGKSNFNRMTARFNSRHEISKYVTFGNNLSLTHTNSKGINENSEFGGILQEALIFDPTVPVHVTDEATILEYDNMPIRPTKDPATGQYYGLSSKALQEVTNPLAEMANKFTDNGAYNVVGDIFLEINPIEGLKLKSDFGIDMGYGYEREYTPATYYSVVKKNPSAGVRQKMDNWNNWQWENTISYTKTLDKHNVTALLGSSARSEKYYDLTGKRTNPSIQGIDYAWLNNGAESDQTASGDPSQHTIASVFGRLAYTYEEKYMATVIARYDGSSRFGSDKKYGFFPSVQLGWVASEESFLKDNSIVTFAKVRFSYGEGGNESIGNYKYLETVSSTNGYALGSDKVATPGSAIDKMANPLVQWESSNEFDIGVDLRFMNDMLQLNADYYNRRRQNLLSTSSIPGFTGLGEPTANIGTVENKGFELMVTYANHESAFKYDISVNGAFNKNEMLEIRDVNKYINQSTPHQFSGNLRVEEGFPLPFFYGYKTNGVFQTDAEAAAYVTSEGKRVQPDAVAGDIRFVDVNNDGVIDENDRTNIGTPTPDFTFGVNFKAEYKNFDVSFFIQGQTGNEIANITQRLELNTTQNYHARYLDRWNGEGSTNEFPRFTYADPNKNYSRINDMVHIEDASYVRLKNAQLGYTLPQTISQKLHVSKLRMYVSGQNLLTLTKYTGMDPEMGHGDVYNGFDRGSYPQARTILFGLNLNF